MKVQGEKFDSARFAEIISEAFPYIRRLSGEVIVIKCSGRVMADPQLSQDFARDLSLLRQIGISIVLVHGGGPQISELLGKLNIESRFHHGLRVTGDEAMGVVEMVLLGSINATLVGQINVCGGNAIGVSGRDGSLIRARKLQLEGDAGGVDLGRVGEVDHVNVDVLHKMTGIGYMPVIAPIGVDEKGLSYNINADVAAAKLASALQCNKFIILTDTAGVLDAQGQLLTDLSIAQVRQLKADGVISGGMLPKLESAIGAIEEGVVAVQIIDGRRPHSLLIELFSDEGIGSLIRA